VIRQLIIYHKKHWYNCNYFSWLPNLDDVEQVSDSTKFGLSIS